MKFKCCRTCKECHLDIRALQLCSVLIDQCAVSKKHITHPWISGWFCKKWRAEDGN